MALNDSDRPPLVGLTSYLTQTRMGVWDVSAAVLPQVYLDGVTNAGGVAVVLPPQPVSANIVDAVLDGIDALIVTGGPDVDPSRYGQEPHTETNAPPLVRDAWEAALLARAIERDIPFLGICRGAQVLNVVRGGTLHQHLPEIVGTERYRLGDGRFGSVPVTLEPGTRLAEILPAGDSAGNATVLSVPVYHHQSIDEVGDGLTVTARSDDGVIEAVELADATYGVAVQWHPEEAPEDVRLFASVVEAARIHRAGKTP